MPHLLQILLAADLGQVGYAGQAIVPTAHPTPTGYSLLAALSLFVEARVLLLLGRPITACWASAVLAW